MFKSASVVLAGLALVVSSTAVIPSATAAEPTVTPTASTGPVVDVTPTTRWLNAKVRHTEFFSATFEAEAGETRAVATELVVWDAKRTAPSELFLGVTLTCTSPSGKVSSAEGGRNVWPASSDFTIPVALLLKTDVAGTYTCQADVMMCDPGDCTAPTGTGVVKIVTRKMNPRTHSFLEISAALPPWAQSQMVPQQGDVIVQAGQTQTVNWGFDLAESPGSVQVGGVLSMTNCIVDGYPDACAQAKKIAVQGRAVVTLQMKVIQQPTESGVTCASAVATSATGAGKQVITWQQHHAVEAVYIPSFELSDAPGCGTSVNAVVTVTVGKGNAVVLESGDLSKLSSLIYVVPAGSLVEP